MFDSLEDVGCSNVVFSPERLPRVWPVRSRKICGGSRDFCSKIFQIKTTSKKQLHFILGAFFSNQNTSNTVFAKFPLTCPKKRIKEITSTKHKNCLHFNFGRHFLEIEAHQAILRRFSHILPRFSPNQNFWKFACTLCNPASYTTRFKDL